MGVVRPDDVALTDAAVSLAAEYGHYGFGRVTALPQDEQLDRDIF